MEITRKTFLETGLTLTVSLLLGHFSISEVTAMTTKFVELRDIVGPQVFQAAGLHKLSRQEEMVLLDWIDRRMNELAKSVEEDCRKGLGK